MSKFEPFDDADYCGQRIYPQDDCTTKLTAANEISDKLEKALKEAIDEIEGMSGQDMSCDPNIVCEDFRELIAEVAAIRTLPQSTGEQS